MRLSKEQAGLLARLPDRPSDGLRCVRAARRTGESLCRFGFAVCVGEHEVFLTRRYARTVEGREALDKARKGET